MNRGLRAPNERLRVPFLVSLLRVQSESSLDSRPGATFLPMDLLGHAWPCLAAAFRGGFHKKNGLGKVSSTIGLRELGLQSWFSFLVARFVQFLPKKKRVYICIIYLDP